MLYKKKLNFQCSKKSNGNYTKVNMRLLLSLSGFTSFTLSVSHFTPANPVTLVSFPLSSMINSSQVCPPEGHCTYCFFSWHTPLFPPPVPRSLNDWFTRHLLRPAALLWGSQAFPEQAVHTLLLSSPSCFISTHSDFHLIWCNAVQALAPSSATWMKLDEV